MSQSPIRYGTIYDQYRYIGDIGNCRFYTTAESTITSIHAFINSVMAFSACVLFLLIPGIVAYINHVPNYSGLWGALVLFAIALVMDICSGIFLEHILICRRSSELRISIGLLAMIQNMTMSSLGLPVGAWLTLYTNTDPFFVAVTTAGFPLVGMVMLMCVIIPTIKWIRSLTRFVFTKDHSCDKTDLS